MEIVKIAIKAFYMNGHPTMNGAKKLILHAVKKRSTFDPGVFFASLASRKLGQRDIAV